MLTSSSYTWIIEKKSIHRQIMDVVCKYFDCSYEDLIVDDRRTHLFRARVVIAYIFRFKLQMTMKDMVALLHHDRTTITNQLIKSQYIMEYPDVKARCKKIYCELAELLQ